MHTEGSPFLELPSLSEYEHSLVETWFAAGTVQNTGQGIAPLTWNELTSWVQHFHREVSVEMVEHPRHSKRHKRTYSPVVIERYSLTDWELQQIKLMSQEYVGEYYSTEPSRPCPKPVYIEDLTEEDAIQNANSIESALDKFFD